MFSGVKGSDHWVTSLRWYCMVWKTEGVDVNIIRLIIHIFYKRINQNVPVIDDSKILLRKHLKLDSRSVHFLVMKCYAYLDADNPLASKGNPPICFWGQDSHQCICRRVYRKESELKCVGLPEGKTDAMSGIDNLTHLIAIRSRTYGGWTQEQASNNQNASMINISGSQLLLKVCLLSLLGSCPYYPQYYPSWTRTHFVYD